MHHNIRCLVRATLAVAVTASLAALPAPLGAQARAIAIRGGTVMPMDGPAIANATVVLQGGKITAVGSNVTVPAGATIVDARGKFVLPGLIDAMTSLGISAGDLNEPADPVSPQLRVFEAYNPFGDFGSGTTGPLRLRELLSGGVTTMYIAPADNALIGGQGAVVKTAGDDLASMSLRDPAAIDIALGEPPRKAASAKQRDPSTRMAEVAMIRQALVKAQEYQRNREQNPNAPRDLGQEALVRLLRREIPARIQANAPVDIPTVTPWYIISPNIIFLLLSTLNCMLYCLYSSSSSSMLKRFVGSFLTKPLIKTPAAGLSFRLPSLIR